jgi:hypothetical protein
VQASATGGSREEAISIANNKGLQETRRLDSNYGGRVRYNPARVNCQQSYSGVSCKITQQFCVDGGETRPAQVENNLNNPGCKGWRRNCAKGNDYACQKVQTNCQND